ncbi:AraC family transcriptional regulator [Mongoliimonas terrestris]|uniref:AraC family transcriptional regulator n=1 Tax=Mongoliimonas terrestris TaxID=1709001 RepID=UPI0009F98191|nr:helix-turn-helix domain-containing protein [Mongoliimonas terrestris]
MPTLPVPMVAAIVFAFLALRTLVLGDRPRPFALLLAAVALQATLLSYHVFAPIRPVTATALPPLAFLVFQVTAVRALDPGRDLWHLAVPAFTGFVRVTAPELLDVLIPAVFFAYGAALLIRLRPGADDLPRIALVNGEQPGLIWRLIAAALILSGIGDLLIGAAMMTGLEEMKPWIIVVMTSGNLVVIGILSLSTTLAGVSPDPADDAEEPAPQAGPSEADAALVAALDDLLLRESLFLDPDLSLARLARRLRLPAKTVSAAVNRATGENVSRHINGHRIRHACVRLDAGDSVTAAMLASGFNTKSNFNREFLRVTGVAPSHWRRSAGERAGGGFSSGNNGRRRADTPHPNPLPQGERGRVPEGATDIASAANGYHPNLRRSPSPLAGEGWGEG